MEKRKFLEMINESERTVAAIQYCAFDDAAEVAKVCFIDICNISSMLHVMTLKDPFNIFIFSSQLIKETNKQKRTKIEKFLGK